MITSVPIWLWSYWDTFYVAEYCDSQLFLWATSHVEEARFKIINLVIIVLQIHLLIIISHISLIVSFFPDSLVKRSLTIHL